MLWGWAFLNGQLVTTVQDGMNGNEWFHKMNTLYTCTSYSDITSSSYIRLCWNMTFLFLLYNSFSFILSTQVLLIHITLKMNAYTFGQIRYYSDKKRNKQRCLAWGELQQDHNMICIKTKIKWLPCKQELLTEEPQLLPNSSIKMKWTVNSYLILMDKILYHFQIHPFPLFYSSLTT